MSKHRILILDDEEAVRNSLVEYFEDKGNEVYFAINVKHALEIINANQVDVAIVDLRLPDEPGDEFIRKNYVKFENMVFIIYTGTVNYQLPPDLQEIPRISKTIFFKPIPDLSVLDNEIDKLTGN
ncbi:response regulator [Spirochaetota bacterium]